MNAPNEGDEPIYLYDDGLVVPNGVEEPRCPRCQGLTRVGGTIYKIGPNWKYAKWYCHDCRETLVPSRRTGPSHVE